MRVSLLSLLFVILIGANTVLGEEDQAKSSQAEEKKAASPVKTKLFEAMDQGLIDVKITTYSSLDAKVTVKNKSGVHLLVELPETFAAVPLAQFGDDFGGGDGGGRRGGRGGGSGRGGSGGGNNGGNQSSGGGFGSSGGFGGGGGMGGGGWSLPPEKILRQDVKTVCLEHGKKEPKRHIDYVIRPLNTVTDKPEVHKLCALVGNRAVDQDAAQAAVWHYNNGLSWEELANKRIRERIDSPRTVQYFSQQQIMYAMTLGKKIEDIVKKEAEERKKEKPQSSSYAGDLN